MRKAKIFFLAATIISIGAMTITGCTKNNTTTITKTDSVFYSAWISLSMTQVNDTVSTTTISAPAITSSILDGGLVIGYLLTSDAINGTDSAVEDANVDLDLIQTFSVGKIELVDFYENLDGQPYRYVVVPGNVMTTNHLTPKELKSMSYTEVTKLLGNTAAKQANPVSLGNQ